MERTTVQSYVNPHAEGCPWHDLAAALGAPNVKWCEETICHWISEPANTMSNVAYLVVAFLLFHQSRSQRQPSHLAFMIGLMGLLSGVYHASNVSITQLADFIGMFIVLGFLIGGNIQILWPRLGFRLRWFTLTVVLVLTPLSILMYVLHWPAQVLIMILGGLLAVLEIYAYRKLKISGGDLLWACGFGLLAAVATFIDHRRVFCFPGNHILQGHALWHICSASAIFFLAKKQIAQRIPHQSHG
jgi:hypothetical protein